MISRSPSALKKIILRDKYNRAIFEKGRGREIFLVGGYVRDTLRGSSSPDRDFIISGDLRSFACEIRAIFGGAIVQFEKGHMIRIALPEGVTFDFSAPDGSLREDLSKRDFTINAIAWSPDSQIVDYYSGREDIKKKTIRVISKENMTSDPLRMLRAYRFAAELNGSIQVKTRRIIKTFRNKIKEVSSERITSELFDLLNSERPSKYLKMALDDGILTIILPFAFKTLANNMRGVAEAEKAIFGTEPQVIKVLLDGLFSQNLTRRGLLYLESLLRNGSLSPPIETLTLSNKIIKRLELIRKGTKLWDDMNELSPDILFDIFVKSREASIDVLMIKKRTDLFKAFEKFRRLWRKGLLSSEEIIDISGLPLGPATGKIIESAKRVQFVGKIRTKKQARAFINKLVQSPD